MKRQVLKIFSLLSLAVALAAVSVYANASAQTFGKWVYLIAP